ncbi:MULTISPECIES: PEP/pyruvate-binding domain-containing protein [unclassified Amycolatopsis]|uniref:PEP/pyruvate-binding domain-containing protein n=1 Tax=unclassified Amycolatopsis TaxID=2618356 RepID=UPI001C6A3189|nr:PEP/pyruvate-binding domain-containing protein [Amycolatopsis sp. DSM 110486]QYN20274.1 hypothetical protein K1T34_48410 [Amycolatopsis sp. DSM 110486]
MTHVRNLAEIRLADAETVGGKAANLGEMIEAGYPVPNGFVMSRDGYWTALEEAGVRARVADLHASALANADDMQQLADACEQLPALVRSAGLTEELAADLTAAYRELGGSAPVAVGSSATGEDGAEASFAGMNASHTNVRGDHALAERVADCWTSPARKRPISPPIGMSGFGEALAHIRAVVFRRRGAPPHRQRRSR